MVCFSPLVLRLLLRCREGEEGFAGEELGSCLINFVGEGGVLKIVSVELAGNDGVIPIDDASIGGGEEGLESIDAVVVGVVDYSVSGADGTSAFRRS